MQHTRESNRQTTEINRRPVVLLMLMFAFLCVEFDGISSKDVGHEMPK